MISLENYNPYERTAPPLDSPRSLKACYKQGFKLEELRFISFEEYKKANKNHNLSGEWLLIRWEHFEKKRENKLRAAKAERLEMINNELLRQKNLKRRKTEDLVINDITNRIVRLTDELLM